MEPIWRKMSPNRKEFIANNPSSPRDEGREKPPLIDLNVPNDENRQFENISSDESSNVHSTRRKLEIGGGSRTIAPNNDAVICSECDERFHTTSELQRHVRSHLEVNLHGQQQPQVDAEEMEVAEALMTLAATGRKDYGETEKATDRVSVGETDGCLFSCSVCKKSFKSRSALRQHRRSYRNISPAYKCDICAREFVNPQGLGSHRRTHPREEENLASTKKRVLMIDLNFPPPSEEDDEE